MPLEDVEWVTQDLALHRPKVLRTQRYDRGEHPILFGSPVWEAFYRHLIAEFADNLMPSVISAPLDRCRITGWDEGEDDGAGDTSGRADELWTGLQGGLRSKQLHKMSFRDGDGYMLVWPDDTPRLWPHTADLMTVRYRPDEPDEPELAGKMWTVDVDEGVERLNVYYPDRVERWVTDVDAAGGWRRYNDDGDGDGDGTIGHRFGRVPVEHFPNDADPGGRGVSELRDAIPLQNALNKAVVDLIIAGEGYSLPTRVVTGYEPDDYGVDDDEPSQAEQFDPRFDRWLEYGGTNTRVFQLPEANLEQLLKVNDAHRLEIARVKGIPLDYFALSGGNVPSGAALDRMRDRLTSKVEDRQESWTSRWRNVAELLGAPATPLWSPAQPRDPKSDAETAAALQDAGVSRRQSLREIGYTDEQIDEMQAEVAADEQQIGRRMRLEAMAGSDPTVMGG